MLKFTSMKSAKLLCLVSFLLVISFSNKIWAQNIIENPSVEKVPVADEYWQVRIAKIDNTKEYTVVHLFVKNLSYYSNNMSFDPKNRYKLVDAATGNTYKITHDLPTKDDPIKIEGMKGGTFLLSFEKIPSEVKKVNLIQGDRQNGGHFYGIDTDFEKYHLEFSRKTEFTGVYFNEDLKEIGVVQIKLDKGNYSFKIPGINEVFVKDNKNFYKNQSDNWGLSISNYNQKDDQIVELSGTLYSNNFGYSPRYWFVAFEGNQKNLIQKNSENFRLEKDINGVTHSIEFANYKGNNKYIRKDSKIIRISSSKSAVSDATTITYINYEFAKHSYSIQGLCKVVGLAKNGFYNGPVIVYKLIRYGDEPATPYYYIGNYKDLFFADGVAKSYNLNNEQTEVCNCANEVLSCKSMISTIDQKKFMEFLGAATIVTAGVSKLIQLASANTGYSSNPSQKNINNDKYTISSQTEKTALKVEFSEFPSKYVSIIVTTNGNANMEKQYFSSVSVRRRDGTIKQEVKCIDPRGDNGLRNVFSYFTFNPSLGEYIRVSVAYGHEKFQLLEENTYSGVGAILLIHGNYGGYTINVLPK